MSKRKKIYLIGGITLLVVLIIGLIFFVMSANKKEAEVVIKDNVRVITEETEKDYQPVRVEEDSITFKKDPEYEKGDVIVAGITDTTPDGFIRRIISVKHENGLYVYETEYAVLTDVFEEAHIIRCFALTEDGVYDIEDPDNTNMTVKVAVQNSVSDSGECSVRPMTYQTTKIDDEFRELPSIVPLSDSDGDCLFQQELDATLSDEVSVTGSVGFDIWIEVKFDIKHGNIEFGIVTHTVSKGELFVGCKGEIFDKDEREGEYTKSIFKKKLPNLQFTIGYVPIVITNDFEATLDASVQLEGSIGMTIALETKRATGFEYNSKTGKVTEINENNYSDDGLEWKTEAKAEGMAEAGVYAHLISKLYGCTGADLAVGIMGNVNGEVAVGIDENGELQSYGAIELKIEPRVKGGIVVTVPVIDEVLADEELFEVALKPLWEKKWASDTNEEESDSNETNAKKTYATRKSAAYQLTCPVFRFEYPDNWEVTTEEFLEAGFIVEHVVLSNERGCTVSYWCCEQNLGGASAVSYLKAKVTKMADAEFTPTVPSGTTTDYSHLGKFVVAKVQIVGELDMLIDSDFREVDGQCFYVTVPESYLGEREFVGQAGYVDEFSFDYPTPYTFVAESPDGTFTEQEEKEIVEILKSFRDTK